MGLREYYSYVTSDGSTVTQESNTTTEENTVTQESTDTANSTTPIDWSTPSPQLAPGAIAGIVVGGAVVALIILLVIIYRKKLAILCSKKDRRYKQDAPFQVNKNQIYDETLADEEFEKLDVFKSDQPQSVAMNPKNINKNRYSDIVPYDYNRVRLDGNVYINASRVEPYFIATQDPMMDETDQLWQMVWENKVAVIVRLSPEEEGAVADSNDGQQRPAVYIPSREWVVATPSGNVVVKTGPVERNDAFVKTEITLTQNESSRQVTHYHIHGWRNETYPNEIATWNTIRTIRETNPSKDRKVLVHCGAGSGRTGTFIALWILDVSHRDKMKTPIFDICLKLREQRPGMVTRKCQYDYIYKCARVLEEGPLKVHC